MPSCHLPPAPPMLKVLPRRQARTVMRRAATCWHSCCPGINASLSPHPLTEGGAARGRVRPGGKGVAAIGFFDPGYHRESRGPVDQWSCHHAPLGLTKRSGQFARFQVPRVEAFLPRVGLFYPRVDFSSHQTITLSLSFFIEGERGEKGTAAAIERSTGSKYVTEMYPRVESSIHGFSVDDFLGRSEQRRGFAAHRPPIHASTDCAACVVPAAARAGGVRG